MSEMIETKKARYTSGERKAKLDIRDHLQVLEDKFDAENFVKIAPRFYNKAHLVSVTFADQTIQARFSTGDIVNVNEEQLILLTT